MMVSKLIALLVVGAGLALAGCNTVRGAGEDLQSVANSVDDAT
jgi:predicted small secreted protein